MIEQKTMPEILLEHINTIKKHLHNVAAQWEVQSLPLETIKITLDKSKLTFDGSKIGKRKERDELKKWYKQYNSLIDNTFKIMKDAADLMGSDKVPMVFIDKTLDGIINGIKEGESKL